MPGGASFEAEWNAKFAEYEKKYKEEAAELKSIIKGELPAGWEKALPVRSFLCCHCFLFLILFQKFHAFFLTAKITIFLGLMLLASPNNISEKV